MLKKPLLIPSAILYVVLIYGLPICVVARLGAKPANWLAAKLFNFSTGFSVIIHLFLLYAALHIWADISAYRALTLKLTLIAIMVTLSLNVINGYMGEFSCSHPGFMALGAYGASVITVLLFVNDRLFGPALLPSALGPFVFPLALIAGGIVAALGALAIAIPSFRTRGDYLAIISLAFMFIVKSMIENLEFVGGPRGLSSQPNWANLPVVFLWTVGCIWIINNFVRSTLGKALNAVRDDEMAANAMTVNTRRTKIVAFMFSAFWAGVAGGLFAHVLRYVNPGTFGLQKLAEVLAMVYFGGLNSVYGSIVGAVSLSLLGEALRPLEIFKWIIIPLLLILVMIYRPTGLIAFKEFNIRNLIEPKEKA
jgi:branched-chain amino acid transport system permease protein